MAATLTPFLGFYTFRFNHDAAFVLSYAPWILIAWLWLAGARTRFHMARAAVLLSVASALVLLASPPKEAAVMLAGCQAAGLLVLLLCQKGRTRTLAAARFCDGRWRRHGGDHGAPLGGLPRHPAQLAHALRSAGRYALSICGSTADPARFAQPGPRASRLADCHGATVDRRRRDSAPALATAGDPGLPRDCDVLDCGGIWCDSS